MMDLLYTMDKWYYVTTLFWENVKMKLTLSKWGLVSQPYFERVWKWNSHSQNGDLCRNPTLVECEDETHTPEMGTWESFGTLETSKFDCRGQNILHWGVFYIIEKLSKCRCRKQAHMGHLNIYNTSYGKRKAESQTQTSSLTLDH